jgi:CheY-like chemotaxis protein
VSPPIFREIGDDRPFPPRDLGALRGRGPEQGGRVPALALTAYVRPEERERALAAGYNQHLAKPIDPIELASAVAQLAERA